MQEDMQEGMSKRTSVSRAGAMGTGLVSGQRERAKEGGEGGREGERGKGEGGRDTSGRMDVRPLRCSGSRSQSSQKPRSSGHLGASSLHSRRVSSQPCHRDPSPSGVAPGPAHAHAHARARAHAHAMLTTGGVRAPIPGRSPSDVAPAGPLHTAPGRCR